MFFSCTVLPNIANWKLIGKFNMYTLYMYSVHVHVISKILVFTKMKTLKGTISSQSTGHGIGVLVFD